MDKKIKDTDFTLAGFIKDNENLMTPHQVSQLLGLSIPALHSWRKKKKHLPYLKIGSSVRYKKEDVKKFIQSGMHEVEE